MARCGCIWTGSAPRHSGQALGRPIPDMMRWLKNRTRRTLVTALCCCGVGVLAGLGFFLAQGRYCDPYVGAVGHPYWQFTHGKVYSVVCGQQTLMGTYRRAPGGWEAVSVSRSGVTNTWPLEFHWSRVVMGQPPMSFPRCWHFWMNSHGPLWNPWD
jgi:hypothetical protein